MIQQTAIEWLSEQILKPDNLNKIRLGGKNDLMHLIEQAKEIENEQLNKARLDGINLANKGYGK